MRRFGPTALRPPGPHPVVASVTAKSAHAHDCRHPVCRRMSSPEHDVVGEVLADDLIRILSGSQSLDVISRLSTTVFRGRATSIAYIGGHLNADYVLCGVYRTDSRTITLDLRAFGGPLGAHCLERASNRTGSRESSIASRNW